MARKQICPYCGREIEVHKPNIFARTIKGLFKLILTLAILAAIVVGLVLFAGTDTGREFVDKAIDRLVTGPEKISVPMVTPTPIPGIRPEVQEVLDGYERYIDDYVAFMSSYDSGSVTMMLKYTKMMTDLASWGAKMDDIEGDLTDEETILFVEIQNRAQEKLLRIAASNSATN